MSTVSFFWIAGLTISNTCFGVRLFFFAMSLMVYVSFLNWIPACRSNFILLDRSILIALDFYFMPADIIFLLIIKKTGKTIGNRADKERGRNNFPNYASLVSR